MYSENTNTVFRKKGFKKNSSYDRIMDYKNDKGSKK